MAKPSPDFPLDTAEEPRVRYEAMDSLRGIAAMSVTLHHLQVASHIYGTAYVHNAYLFVEFFFVLSGFVIAHAYADKIGNSRQFARFSIKRIGRVWPLHVIMLGAFVLAETAMWAASRYVHIALPRPSFSEDRTILGIPLNFFMLNGIINYPGAAWNGPSWSVSAELIAYILFGMTILFTTKRDRTLLWAILMVAAMTCIAAGFGATKPERSIYGFFMGAIAWKFRNRWPGHQATIQQLVAIALIAILLSFDDYRAQLLIGPPVFTIAVLSLCNRNGVIHGLLRRQPFLYLGKISYSIYMVHFFIAFGIYNAIKIIGHLTGHNWVYPGTDLAFLFNSMWIMDAVTIAFWIIVIAAASLAFRYVEKPGMAAFGKLADQFNVKSRDTAVIGEIQQRNG